MYNDHRTEHEMCGPDQNDKANCSGKCCLCVVVDVCVFPLLFRITEIIFNISTTVDISSETNGCVVVAVKGGRRLTRLSVCLSVLSATKH